MLKYKNGSFHACGVSFRLPEGACLETESVTFYEYGLTAWLEKHDLWFEIFVDDEDDPRADLETLFTDESSTFVPYSPITEILHNGMRGHEVFYHDSKSDYYECRLIVSEGISVVFYAWCHRDSVKNIKALPEIQDQEKGYISVERDNLETLLDSGFVDAFRHLHPDQEGAYTWWSQRFEKRSKNDGWRLDYFLVDRQLAKQIHAAEHHTEIYGSDHCPIALKIHLNYVVGEKFDRSKLHSIRPSIDFPDAFLGELWEKTDWTAAEQILANLQKKIALAAQQRDDEKIKALQMQLVRRTEIKQLAVRQVCSGDSGPGVDGVKWKTPGEKMRAALMLTSKNYRAQPMRDIKVKSKPTGRERTYGLPTYFDRAMQILYGFSLAPVLEAWAEKKSFAFRKGRSPLDAHAYILEILQGPDAPEVLAIIDVKSCYANIQRDWLMVHIPMDKKVLGEFLRAGHVFAGELFPEEETGISEGANLSPMMANHVLDGLQGYIYRHLYNGMPVSDYANGNLVRFADDMFLSARTRKDAEKMVDITRHYLHPQHKKAGTTHW